MDNRQIITSQVLAYFFQIMPETSEGVLSIFSLNVAMCVVMEILGEGCCPAHRAGGWVAI